MSPRAPRGIAPDPSVSAVCKRMMARPGSPGAAATPHSPPPATGWKPDADGGRHAGHDHQRWRQPAGQVPEIEQGDRNNLAHLVSASERWRCPAAGYGWPARWRRPSHQRGESKADASTSSVTWRRERHLQRANAAILEASAFAMPTPTTAPSRQGIAASANTSAITPASEYPMVLRTANSATPLAHRLGDGIGGEEQDHQEPDGGHALGHQRNVEAVYRAILLLCSFGHRKDRIGGTGECPVNLVGERGGVVRILEQDSQLSDMPDLSQRPRPVVKIVIGQHQPASRPGRVFHHSQHMEWPDPCAVAARRRRRSAPAWDRLP